MNDSYQILGLAPGSPKPAIQKAYRAKAKSAHPDNTGGDADQFHQLRQAYETLINQPILSSEHQTKPPRKERSFSHQYFLQVLARKHKPRPKVGKDIKTNLEVPLVDLIKGATRRITLASGTPLEIKIPKGHHPAHILRLQGKGEMGTNSGPAGDVLVHLGVKPEEGFFLKGRDIHTHIAMDLADLRRGGKQRLYTPGGYLEITIPVLAQPGLTLRLAGKGLPANGKFPDGDLYVRLDAKAANSLARSVDQFARAFAS